MSDTVKLIIEISKATYEDIKSGKIYSSLCEAPQGIVEGIQNGIPLDDIDSDETRAYFDGQAYGWEEGRKDLRDEISAEIEHEKGKWDYLSSDTCFDIAIGVVKRYEKEAEGKEVDG